MTFEQVSDAALLIACGLGLSMCAGIIIITMFADCFQKCRRKREQRRERRGRAS